MSFFIKINVMNFNLPNFFKTQVLLWLK